MKLEELPSFNELTEKLNSAINAIESARVNIYKDVIKQLVKHIDINYNEYRFCYYIPDIDHFDRYPNKNVKMLNEFIIYLTDKDIDVVTISDDSSFKHWFLAINFKYDDININDRVIFNVDINRSLFDAGIRYGDIRLNLDSTIMYYLNIINMLYFNKTEINKQIISICANNEKAFSNYEKVLDDYTSFKTGIDHRIENHYNNIVENQCMVEFVRTGDINLCDCTDFGRNDTYFTPVKLKESKSNGYRICNFFYRIKNCKTLSANIFITDKMFYTRPVYMSR
jgi:hypothetical protein